MLSVYRDKKTSEALFSVSFDQRFYLNDPFNNFAEEEKLKIPQNVRTASENSSLVLGIGVKGPVCWMAEVVLYQGGHYGNHLL